MPASLWIDWNGPLLLSARVALLATLLSACVGLPCAYLLARRRGFLPTALEALLIAPLVLPPTVVGYLLLVLVGRRTLLGGALYQIGIEVVFTELGAVIAAFVVSLPLFILPSKAAMQAVPVNLFALAATEGLGRVATFRHVVLPTAVRGIQAGVLLCFARALGEFGATLMVAGNIPGRTTTLPMVIYTAMATGQESEAIAPVLILTSIALLIIGLNRRLVRPVR